MRNGLQDETADVIVNVIAKSDGAVSRVPDDDDFARMLSSIARRLGCRLTISTKKPTEGDPATMSSSIVDPSQDHETVLHLYRPNSGNWQALGGTLANDDELWRDVPYRSLKQLFVPIALTSLNLREGISRALGESVTTALEPFMEKLHAERARLLETSAAVPDALLHAPPDDALEVLESFAFPFDWLERTVSNNASDPHPHRTARALARLTVRSDASKAHASLHLRNAIRIHQVRTIENIVRLGLLTLRNVNDRTDREFFESLLGEFGKKAFMIWFAHTHDNPDIHADISTDDLPDDPATSAWKELRKMCGNANDLLTRMRGVEEFVRNEREKGWEHISKNDRSDMAAFLSACDFLNNPPDEIVQKLRDMIDVRRCREELEAARRCHLSHIIGAKQSEIIQRVTGAIFRYPHSQQDESDVASRDDCALTFVRDNKEINCFTGPWLTAAMLLECGFDEGRMMYCDVQGVSGTTYGIHGSLMVALDSGQQLLIDIGFKSIRNVPFGLYKPAVAKKLRSFVGSESSQCPKVRVSPILATLSNSIAQKTNIHRRMAVMPIRQGFAWGTLLTMGIDSFEAGNTADARHAFELAHALHPASPDILIWLACCSEKEGDRSTAKILLEDAMARCPDNKHAQYRRALLHISDGEYDEARCLIDTVLDDRATWHGGAAMIEHARTISALLSDMFMLRVDELLLGSDETERVIRIDCNRDKK